MHIRGPRIQEGPPITKATTMNVFLLIAAAIILIVVLLRFKCPIGPAILAGGALLWLFEDPTLRALTEAGHDMLTMNRTYDLLFALYFVMCLEIQLRKSGTLRKMVEALNRMFASEERVCSGVSVGLIFVAVLHQYISERFVFGILGEKVLALYAGETIESASQGKVFYILTVASRKVYTLNKVEYIFELSILLSLRKYTLHGGFAHTLYRSQSETDIAVAVYRELKVTFVYIRT